MLIAPSMLSSDFSTLGEETARMERAGADWIHLDVMDAHFVPNLTFGAPIVGAIRPYTKLPFDVHLMISEPLRYVDDFLKAGADIISFHLEAESSVRETIRAIRAGGAKPARGPEAQDPGGGGAAVFGRPRHGFGHDGGARLWRAVVYGAHDGQCAHPQGSWRICGSGRGVNPQTAVAAKEAGVDVCVAGTSVFHAPDAAKAIATLREGNGVVL